ncbi:MULTISPECIES: hypothetical protein [Parachlamydia]|uniref:hypothetical protein n=1 Tax=Parachlamydia TaxID=83551 RepID=UPI0001C176C2|nr:hypothetical protein [Parachlamydia acanthamoebae]EFB41615.1 hypothetical protein pah_c026o046 [Parachlamydia acanthamoebae str. Hall's coccus]
MSISFPSFNFYSNQLAEKLPNSSGKRKKRIEFCPEDSSNRYLIAYDKIIRANVTPQLDFFARKRFFLIQISDTEYAKVNKNSFLKRFGISKETFKENNSKEKLAKLISSQIAQAESIHRIFGQLSPKQMSKLKSDYVMKELKDDAVFLGCEKNGLRTGHCLLKTSTGEKFEGTYVDGKVHGKAKMTTSQGDTYEYTYKNGAKHGKMKATLKNGTVFVGAHKDDVLVYAMISQYEKKAKGHVVRLVDGSYQITTPGGLSGIYRGTLDVWGRFQTGHINFGNGARFEGSFKDFDFLKGEFSLPSGESYKGDFDGSGNYAEGLMTFADGSSFEGKFFNNKPFLGIKQLPDGRVQDGQFRGGLFFYGKLTNNGVLVFEGRFNENEQFEKGTYYATDRTIYQGLFEGEHYTEGTISYPDGIKFIGKFSHSEPISGEMLFPPEHPQFVRFEGTLEDGKMQQGTLLFKDGYKYVGHITDEVFDR